MPLAALRCLCWRSGGGGAAGLGSTVVELFFGGVLLVFLLLHSWVCSLLGDAKRQRRWRTGAVALSRPRVTFRMCPTTQVVPRRCAVLDARSLSIALAVQCHGLVCLAMLDFACGT
ncbi:hypothetical protein ACQJBY_073524 [Aegilops geniculata]